MSTVTDTPSVQIPNDVPQDLLDLAILAIEQGFDDVRLGFEGLGAGTPFPMGWILHLTRRDVRSLYYSAGPGVTEEQMRAEHLVVTCQQPVDAWVSYTEQIDLGLPRAYVNLRLTANPLAHEYWVAKQIREWIQTPSPFATEPSEAELALAAQAVELFVATVRAGWSATHKLGRGDELSMLPYGTASAIELQATMSTRLTIHALNNFYNTEDHPENRQSGAAVSAEHTILNFGERSSVFMGSVRSEQSVRDTATP